MKKDREQGGFLQKTVKRVGDIVHGMKEGAQERAQKKQVALREAQRKKYNPLFLDQYADFSFKLPNLIVIVDDAVRKGIEVCEGAIGWLSKEKGVEVLHLYDEFVNQSGLRFFPTPMCDVAYYVDQHDRSTFINVDNYLSNMQEEKLAELQHIAFCVGAKSYSVEMIEDNKEKASMVGDFGVSEKKGKKAQAGVGVGFTSQNKNSLHTKALAEATFESKREPIEPKLVWFAHDRNVLNLIQMRCAGQVVDMKNYAIELQSTTTMFRSTMAKLDGALASMKMNSKLKMEIEKECRKKMVFKLKF